jgi:hypothetical protein
VFREDEMTLIGFHRTLITAAILFCGGYAAWEYSAYAGGAGTGALILAIVFTALAGGLVYYLINLRRFLQGRTS